MDEKTMVNDIINCINYHLLSYEITITETQDLELRQTLQTLRNNQESFQYELCKVAKMKEYYKPEEEATTIEIQNVKNQLQ